MIIRTIILIMSGCLFFTTFAFSQDNGQRFMNNMPPNIVSVEWSNYGLGFEWAKDNKTMKKLNLSEQQQEELNKLIESAKTISGDENSIKQNEEDLKGKIELKKVIQIVGEKENPDQAEVEVLVDQVNKQKSELFKKNILLKTRLRLLLTEDQRNVLHAHFKDKEKEQRDKMKAEMGREGGPGGRGGMGGPGGGGMGGGPGGGMY
jgi:Spy/CpxP family protein refolding chaperone